jgi:CRISPR-associated protein Cmr4
MGTPTFGDVRVLGLYTETSLHCGSESAGGYVDLPVQRERHTNFPVIPGSTIKGVFRDELKSVDLDKIFGRQDSPGQVSFGDGMLVAFPVRSSGQPFHWVTCPFVLERLMRVLQNKLTIDDPGKGKAWAKTDGVVLLEELTVSKKANPTLFPDGGGGLSALLELIPSVDRGFEYTRGCFLDRLLVLDDDDFRELVETGTEVLTRIKLTALGTTTDIPEGEHPEISSPDDRKGNMFVEEVVPPETLFVTTLRSSAAAVLETLDIPKLVRFGGDETIGRGLTHVTVAGGR